MTVWIVLIGERVEKVFGSYDTAVNFVEATYTDFSVEIVESEVEYGY